MEGRMTMCNMSIEAGARAGLIAPDQTTFDYITAEERPFAPKGEALDEAMAYWKSLPSDPDAVFDRVLTIAADEIAPQVTWGTSPGMVIDVDQPVPALDGVAAYDPSDVQAALDYMGLKSGEKLTDVKLDTIFIGSCTNSRIEDLRRAAKIFEGRKKADHVKVLVVPGSQQVREQASRKAWIRYLKTLVPNGVGQGAACASR